MTDAKEVLTKLGWSEELIDAFMGQYFPSEVADLPEHAADFKYVDAAEVTLQINEPMIHDGTNLHFIVR